ncbi:hypothetical protein M0638_24130 [Roseomonas sp. NAR14]|uniref:Uncharacterized protein n=1 Tax=Roseomonas acroporae TaxID=2937791 RepID=A0A9X1YE50_9PROT|nr:hypothetical protein [Roseomonas acroporae]MCK8787463.1 hypothetical protein [Roseomonas acroporae]
MGDTLRAAVAPSLDAQVRRRLRTWPQRPPGAGESICQPGTWLRGRPNAAPDIAQPFLKLPGSNRLRTLPDGLWLHFSADRHDPYVDVLCIEACSSLQNLLDKRSRFAPSTGSLLAVCPQAWLMAPAQPDDTMPRWKQIRLLWGEPAGPLVLPVRDVRVLFGLKAHHYDGFVRSQAPHPHEYYCKMDVLTDEHGPENPALRALIARAGTAANFMELP